MASILKFDNVLNVRDFGGHALGDGSKIANGKLLRGAQLSKMSAGDHRQFEKHNVSLIVDLRHEPERNRQGSNWPESKMPNTFVYDDAVSPHQDNQLAPHEIFIIRELKDPEDAHNYMIGSYGQRPHDAGFVSVTSKSLKHMANTGEHIYVHCAAGKDRTGTFSAIVLMALGLSADDVMSKYMLTRKAVDIEPILQMAAKRMEKQYGRPYNADALRPIFGVEPEFLQASLDAMGDFDTYWNDVLGLSHKEIGSLKSHYTK